MSFLSPSRLRAKVGPHLHWRVPAVAGAYGSPAWSNPDIDPVPIARQTWGSLVSMPGLASSPETD